MTDPDTLQSLGRVEGKLDLLINLHSKQESRLDAIDKAHNDLATKVSSITGSNKRDSEWWRNGISLSAVFVAILAFAKSYIHL